MLRTFEALASLASLLAVCSRCAKVMNRIWHAALSFAHRSHESDTDLGQKCIVESRRAFLDQTWRTALAQVALALIVLSFSESHGSAGRAWCCQYMPDSRCCEYQKHPKALGSVHLWPMSDVCTTTLASACSSMILTVYVGESWDRDPCLCLRQSRTRWRCSRRDCLGPKLSGAVVTCSLRLCRCMSKESQRKGTVTFAASLRGSLFQCCQCCQPCGAKVPDSACGIQVAYSADQPMRPVHTNPRLSQLSLVWGLHPHQSNQSNQPNQCNQCNQCNLPAAFWDRARLRNV